MYRDMDRIVTHISRYVSYCGHAVSLHPLEPVNIPDIVSEEYLPFCNHEYPLSRELVAAPASPWFQHDSSHHLVITVRGWTRYVTGELKEYYLSILL